MPRSEKEIGDYTFYIAKFKAYDAIKIVGDLQKKLVNPAAHLIATQRNAASTDEQFVQGLQEFSKGMDGATLLWAFKTLITPDTVSVRLPTGDVEKCSEQVINAHDIPPDVLLALAIEVVRLNFISFFKSARNHISQVFSQSQTDSQ